jgi:hypothetical protein
VNNARFIGFVSVCTAFENDNLPSLIIAQDPVPRTSVCWSFTVRMKTLAIDFAWLDCYLPFALIPDIPALFRKFQGKHASLL